MFLHQCNITNYKSIEACKVKLQPLNFLIGPNGSGKSNFLDALRFVSESLQTSLGHAIQDRGGLSQIRRKTSGHPTHFSIALQGEINARPYYYAFKIGAASSYGFEVTQELLKTTEGHYEIKKGIVSSCSLHSPPKPSLDRLYLVSASGLSEFRPVYDALSSMGFYNIQPDKVKNLQPPEAGALLARDGRNLASVLKAMASASPQALDKVVRFLSRIVPGLKAVEPVALERMLTLDFIQTSEDEEARWRFPALSMSDGTLRALAILVALYQPAVQAQVPLVGIEEPEAALHPAAGGVLMDALRGALDRTQVIITSHSPDLLDHDALRHEEILVVQKQAGKTAIGPLDEASRGALKEHLYTGGEMLRAQQLWMDPQARIRPAQIPLAYPKGAP
jgi:predicted ATPase